MNGSTAWAAEAAWAAGAAEAVSPTADESRFSVGAPGSRMTLGPSDRTRPHRRTDPFRRPPPRRRPDRSGAAAC